MATKSFIKTIGSKGLLADYNTSGKKLLTEDSIDQTYSSTSTKAQSGVAVNEAFKTRETSTSDDSYTYLGMSKPFGSPEALYWKLVSFNAVNNYWTFQFEVDVSNGRKGNAAYDTEIYETKRLTICGTKPGSVSQAKELRYVAQGVDSNRGYGNNIYYEIGSSNLVTLYIKAINQANKTQICRLKDVINFQGISNITWHEASNDAGTQPTNPVKFKELFPSISSTSSDIGSDSVPVYINRGKPVSCNSSNLKAGKDDDDNVIKNTYQKKLIAGDNVTIDSNTISSNQVFVATYGTTTYQEIKAAYEAGKICVCRYTDNTTSLLYAINSSEIRFAYSNPYASSMIAFFISKNNVWSVKYTNLQNKLTFDTTPTAGSNNPVTSDGIKTALNNYVGIYKRESSNFHVKNNEYYSFICKTQISNWEKIQADFFCPNSDSSTVGKFNIFATLSTTDTSLHTPERVAELGGIVWDYNYKGYNSIKYRIYVAKSGDEFYFYAKRNSSNDISRTAFRSCLLYTSNTGLTDNVSADLDDATWQTLSLVEMKNVYSSTTQERLDSHTNDTTVHITAAERKAWNAKQSALTFDATPTAGSTNPVTSDGIKTALDSRVPAPTSTTGTQVLKCIDGVIQWVSE